MSCPCFICKTHEPVPTHTHFVKSKFTSENSYGLVSISNVSSSPSSALKFKINKTQAALDMNFSAILPTWIIEDVLFIEAYEGSISDSLIGTGSIPLAYQAFDDSLVEVNLDSFIDEPITVSFKLSFESKCKNIENPSYMIFRKTSRLDPSYKYTLEIINGEKTDEIRIKDESQGYKDEVWHHISTIESFEVMNLNFKMTNLNGTGKARNFESSTTIQKKNFKNVPYFFTLRSPTVQFSSFLTFYLVPFNSQFITCPTGSFEIKFLPQSNRWISDFIAERGYFQFQLMTLLVQHQVKGEIQVEELSQILEHQEYAFKFDTRDINDKLVVKLFSYKENQEVASLCYVGMIKFKETPGFKYRQDYQCIVQFGPFTLDVTLSSEESKIEENPQKFETSVSEFKDPEPANLTYKDRTFFNVLDLMEFKIHQISKRNSLTTTHINKLKTRNELLRKQIFDLEHSHPITEFDNIVQQSALKPKKMSNSQSISQILPGNSIKPLEETAAPKYQICSCGNRNPKFKGYCENCVKTLKDQYERVLKWYTPIKNKFDELERKYTGINARKILFEGKIIKLQEKLKKPVDIEEGDTEEVKQMMVQLTELQNEVENMQEEARRKTEIIETQKNDIQVNLSEKEKEEGKLQKKLRESEEKAEIIAQEIDETNKRMVDKKVFNDKYRGKYLPTA
ncbi:unnamed protein product [Blepharisma stoltei]|uniref:Uncharacterized protein n=1 Tax=Blepharisma stoltei TaxID=1481888 RepID=A0AAU9IJM2_9CILI|nr:unnamed protein product [Blepharisma stoltei]